MIQDNPAFLRWAGSDAEPVVGHCISDHDWSLPGPHILEAFHGTTHEFLSFTLNRNTHEAQFGKVHYFTSCSWDATSNYASDEGPDLVNRIERKTELLEDEISTDPEAFDLDEDADSLQISECAGNMARAELVGPVREVMEVYLRLNNPFVIDAAGQTDRQVFNDAFGHSDAIAAVADEHGITPDEVEDNIHDYDDEIYETLDDAWAQTHDSIACALMRVANNIGCDTPAMPEIADLLLDITCNTFERSFKDSESLVDLSDEEGTLVSGSFFAGLLEELGYDSIVLLNADKRFKNMNMMPATTHIHMMNAARTQIKSVQNCGDFDPENAAIHA